MNEVPWDLAHEADARHCYAEVRIKETLNINDGAPRILWKIQYYLLKEHEEFSQGRSL